MQYYLQKNSENFIVVHPVEEQEFKLLTKEEFTENSFFLPGFILERQFSEIQTRTFDTVNTTSKYTYIVSIVLLNLNFHSSFNFGSSYHVQKTQVQ